MPSVDQRSGRLLSAQVMVILSPSTLSISPFTNNAASSSRRFCVSSFFTKLFKSLREISIVGMLHDHPRFTQPFEILAAEVPEIFNPKIKHCKPVQAKSPCHDRHVDAQCFCDFWSENTRTAKFYPT